MSDEERRALDVLVEQEERTAGDVLRRALRAYAQQAGVMAAPREPKKAARKKSA
jgi:hypothetical protein